MTVRKRRRSMADRLMAALDAEMRALERTLEENNPENGRAGGKVRIDAIGQVTRTLEKLLELRRLEALANATGEEADAAETAKARAEMMKRLRAIDERREAGAGLFTAGDEA